MIGKLGFNILLNRMYNALFFATLKRRAGGVSLEGSYFFDKNFQFLSKKQLPSDRLFLMSSSMILKKQN